MSADCLTFELMEIPDPDYSAWVQNYRQQTPHFLRSGASGEPSVQKEFQPSNANKQL